MLDPALIRYVTDPTEAARRAAQLATEAVLGVGIETYPAAAYRDRPGAALDPQTAKIRLLQVAALDGRVALFDLQQVPLDALALLSATPWATFRARSQAGAKLGGCALGTARVLLAQKTTEGISGSRCSGRFSPLRAAIALLQLSGLGRAMAAAQSPRSGQAAAAAGGD
ncbi:hypothetical protein CCR96_06220 [Halochromatium roseum]|nr:hypothetical protein [Halochromatium roseum]